MGTCSLRLVFGVLVLLSSSLLWLPACEDGDEDDETGDASADIGDVGDDAPACTSEPSSLSDCLVGDFFAECGSPGTPTLACSTSESPGSPCFWFNSACLPPGFESSDCPAEQICCAQGWPYQGLEFYADLHPLLFAYGRGPWTAEREMSIDVVIDAGVEAPSEPSLVCNGAFDFEDERSPCSGGYTTVEFPGTLLVRFNPGGDGVVVGSGWRLVVEVDLENLKARACQYRFSDTTPETCSEMESPACAESGELFLSRAPEAGGSLEELTGTLSATFGGVEIEARF